MYINFNDLLEGDTKYYKSAQDFLKRAKESQGSGVPYGIVDFTERLDAPRHQVPSALESLTFGPKGYKVEQFNRFRAVTVKNTVKTDTPMLEQMVKILTDKNYMGENAEIEYDIYYDGDATEGTVTYTGDVPTFVATTSL